METTNHFMRDWQAMTGFDEVRDPLDRSLIRLAGILSVFCAVAMIALAFS